LPVWSILLSQKTERPETQRELAAAVGIQGATLTHHLNAMELNGLITRTRDPKNRRIHQVELTDQGQELFLQLVNAAIAQDARLRTGLADEETGQLGRLLDRLQQNVTG
jgi:MarR family transcriptional regulator for hemolysin